MHPIKSRLATGGLALSAMVFAMLAGCDETARRTVAPASPDSTNSAAYVAEQPALDDKNVPRELKRWNASAADSR